MANRRCRSQIALPEEHLKCDNHTCLGQQHNDILEHLYSNIDMSLKNAAIKVVLCRPTFRQHVHGWSATWNMCLSQTNHESDVSEAEDFDEYFNCF